MPPASVAPRGMVRIIRTMFGSLRYVLLWLARPAIMFFALPWLMVLLVLGTVSQRYIGLYASQKLFFGSFVLWAGLVPLPGAYSVLALITVSLFAKLLLKSPFRRQSAGTVFIHVSALVLLLGGLITATHREEGYVVLGDGDSADRVQDYQTRALEIRHDGKLVKAAPFSTLGAGSVVEAPAVPFSLRVVRACFPCGVRGRTGAVDKDMRGVAAKMELVTMPYSKEDAQNLTGMTLAVSGTGSADGTYILYETLAEPENLDLPQGRYSLALKPVTRPLPFNVRLKHFTKDDYPGTDEARAYRSEVEVSDGGFTWGATIEMNNPLRYKGYTFYQSSFVREGDKFMSVLAVVRNAGEWFPYIGLFMLAVGLLLHVLMTLRVRNVTPRG